jgi:hypothetical protein
MEVISLAYEIMPHDVVKNDVLAIGEVALIRAAPYFDAYPVIVSGDGTATVDELVKRAWGVPVLATPQWDSYKPAHGQVVGVDLTVDGKTFIQPLVGDGVKTVAQLRSNTSISSVTLRDMILAEATARTNADAVLQTAITAETTARQSADAAEATARIAGDGYIQNNLDAVTPKAMVTEDGKYLRTMSGVQLIANEGQALDSRYVMKELDHLQEQIRAICAIFPVKFLETMDGCLLKTLDGKYMRTM